MELTKKILNELQNKLKIPQSHRIQIQKVSTHDIKYKVTLNNRNLFIYLHQNSRFQEKEKMILQELEKAKIKAPRFISSGIIDPYYYNLVSEIKMKSLDDQEIDDYNIVSQKLFYEIKKIHSIRKNKNLIHGDLNTKNILYDGQNIAFLDFTYSYFSDPLVDFSWIYLASKFYAEENYPKSTIYKKLWILYLNENKPDPAKMRKFMVEFMGERRFNGKLHKQFIDKCLDDFFQNKKTNAVLEKRKWVGITNYCNNRCIFCLDGDIPHKRNKKISEIEKELDEGIKEECTRLVLSGGEASIHPNFIDFISLGKDKGYKKIQVITNGRMFSYESFLNKSIKAGLNEITFSIHGHKKELHDTLTGVKGSFDQTIRAIKNALSKKIIVNADIVLNKMNVKYFPEIISFLLNLGVNEFDILQIMPYGRAFKHKEELFYEISDYLSFIKQGFDIAERNGAVLWTNRFPPEYLEGYEKPIQDPYKFVEEIKGRKEDFKLMIRTKKKPSCSGNRCNFCCLKEFCQILISKTIATPKHIDVKTNKSIKEIIIQKKNYKNLLSLNNISNKKLSISLVCPDFDYLNYSEIVPKITNIVEYIYDLDLGLILNITNIPFCMIKKKYWNLIYNKSKNLYNSQNPVIIAEKYFRNKKIKSLRCKNCIYDLKCGGLFQKYIMHYGFDEIKPIKNKTEL